MKGRGELAQSPLRANVLFITRVSEISCEVVEEELRWECGEGIGSVLDSSMFPWPLSPGPVCSLQRQVTAGTVPSF